MRLEIDKVIITNFKSFVGTHVFDIARLGVGLVNVRGQNLDEPQLGSNGAGKSSLFGAMCWCLHGKTENGLRNPDIRPWRASETTKVVVHLAIDDEPHNVQRSAEPNRLLLDGRAVGQESIDQLLGMDYELFTHTILLGQGQPLFLDLPPREKMDLFTTVLALERWERRSARASVKATEHANMLRDEQVLLSATLRHIQSADERIAANQPRVDGFEGERQAKLVAFTGQMADKKRSIEALAPQVDAATLVYDTVGAELRLLNQDVEEQRSHIMRLERERAIADERVNAATAQVRTLERQLGELTTARNCPTCGQPVQRGDLDAHKHHLKQQLTEAEQTANWTRPPDERTDARIQLEHLNRRAQEMRQRISDAEAIITAHGPTLIRLRADVQHLSREHDSLVEQQNPYRAALEDAKRQRAELAVVQRDTEARIIMVNRDLERTKFWVKGFKEVRLTRTDEALADLEMATNSTLASVGLEGWRIQFVIEEETQRGTIKRGMAALIYSPNNREPVRWESWSGGEAQRLRVICALSLADTLLSYAGVSCGFEALDEPTAHLSGYGIRDLCEFLAERARAQQKGIYFIDHRALADANFDATVEVVKQGGSRIL